jgi:hypothetical protein
VLVRDYVSRKKRVDEILADCVGQGVKVQEPNLPAFLDHSLRIERSLHDLSGRHSVEQTHSLPIRDEKTEKYVRIVRWTHDVRLNKPFQHTTETWASLSGTTKPPSQKWSHEQLENDLAFPHDNYMEPYISEPDDSVIDGERQSSRRGVPLTFEGEPPTNRRRYSAPVWPTFQSPIELEYGALEKWQERSVVRNSDHLATEL